MRKTTIRNDVGCVKNLWNQFNQCGINVRFPFRIFFILSATAFHFISINCSLAFFNLNSPKTRLASILRNVFFFVLLYIWMKSIEVVKKIAFVPACLIFFTTLQTLRKPFISELPKVLPKFRNSILSVCILFTHKIFVTRQTLARLFERFKTKADDLIYFNKKCKLISKNIYVHLHTLSFVTVVKNMSIIEVSIE